jgi:N-acetyl-anhydromuramyl-L-alanine amidase AmpD
MKKFLLIVLTTFFSIAHATDLLIENPFRTSFKKAYSLHPSIPKGILEAVAYTQTRFQHITDNQEPSCSGYPQTFGVMGLVQDGKGYFRNSLTHVSQFSDITEEAIISSAETCILAYATAFENLQSLRSVHSNNIQDYLPILVELSELPLTNDLPNNFAMNAHLYQILWFLNNSEFQEVYEFPQYNIDLASIFGSNYQILSAKSISISKDEISNEAGHLYNVQNIFASPDYSPAVYSPAASCNYSSRNGTSVSAVTIHFVQGTYAGCVSWFQNCNAAVSAHYVVRSSDGQVTQMVLESAKAWHVGSENPYTVGIEHEGYINNISWFTTAMYNSSAALTKDICTDNSIPKLRTYYGPGCSGSSQQCALGACPKVKGHQMFPNQTHNDPGPLWDWSRFYKLINNTYSISATYTLASGNFYDSGGAGANYSDDERKFWLFTMPNINNITLNFTSFNIENNYDHLFIYNGGSINSPLIGDYTGTVNPGPVTSTNDSLLVEFRSDCATNASGWAAGYIMNGTIVPTPSDNIAPTTSVITTNAWETAAFTSTITDLDNQGGSGVQKGYYQVIDFDGTEWRANAGKGFFADNFDNAIHPDWTVKTGTWNVTGNALVQTDEVSLPSANTNIYAALTQSLSNRYLYHFLGKFEGAGASRRAGFHFMVDQPDSSNRNNSYFVWFRLDNQKVQIYKVVNNVFGSPQVDLPLAFNANQWYDIKTIYDRITGKITVYWNNSPIATWTDPSPIANGNYVSFRSANCKFSIDEIKVYRSRNNLVSIPTGTLTSDEMRYQNPSPLVFAGKIKSICQDSAGNLSSIYYKDINVDWTPPTNIPLTYDGNAFVDVDNVITQTSLSASWQFAGDPHSSVAEYYYSIGTAPGSTNVLGWTYNWGSNTVTANNLSLTHNTTYYFNVRAVNGAGLWSGITSSDGVKVDTNMASIGMKEQEIKSGLKIYPNPFRDHVEVEIENEFDGDFPELSDAFGRKIAQFVKIEGAMNEKKRYGIETANLAAGVYFIVIPSKGRASYYKIVKE